MAHIHDIISEITQFLNGRDHSCSERFRSLAEDYAAACREVIESLEECRTLIARGQALQALNLNQQSSPMLTERARFLMFPGRPQWLELCTLYKVSLPPEFDMELIDQLESKDLSESVEQTSDLISQWHVLGHTGTNHEKIILLRKLLQKDKTTKIWRKNLEIAEKAWCREMLNNAAAAQKIKDYACLDSIVIQLNSPELLHPVQPSLLEPFQKDLRSYRITLMQKKQEQVLSEIMSAYNMEDIDALGSALCKWTALSEEALFTAPNSTDSDTLKKAQEHYRQKTEQILLQNKADELHKTVNAQIAACESFPKIRASMFQLKELSLPIDPDLETRYKALEDEYFLIQKRKTGTKRFIWGSVIVIFCAAVCAAVFIVNEVTAIRNICTEMQTSIQNKKPQDVIAYYENLKKQKNPYITNEDIYALYNQAVGLKKQYETEVAVYAKLLSSIKSKLDRKEIDQTEKLFAEANSEKLYRTAQQKEELIALNVRQKELLSERQKNRNQEFENQYNQLMKKSRILIQMLNKPDKLNIDEVKQQAEEIKTQKKNLLRNRLHASEEILDAKKDTLENITRLLREQIKYLDKYAALRKKLYTPETVESFIESLNDIRKLEQYSQNLSSNFMEALQQKQDLQQYLSVTANTFTEDMAGSRHPYIKDLCIMNPSQQVMNTIRADIDRQKKAVPVWDLHEFILEANGKKMYFYVRPPLDDENLRVYRAHGRAGGAFKDLRMNICTPNGQSQELVFKIPSKKKGMYDLKLVKAVDGIPGQFENIPREQLLSWANRNNVDKALHYTKFNHTLDRLLKIKNAAAFRNQIVNEVSDYISDKNMNPAAKNLIIQNLLTLYGKISVLDYYFTDQIIQHCNFTYTDPLDYHTDSSKLQDKLKFFTTPAFQKILSNRKDTVHFYQYILFAMAPNPVGIIYRNETEYWVHFFGNAKPGNMYFVCLNDRNDSHFYIFSDKILKTARQPISKLPPVLRKIYNGTVLFVPSDQFTQKELQKKMKNVFSFPAAMPIFAESAKK